MKKKIPFIVTIELPDGTTKTKGTLAFSSEDAIENIYHIFGYSIEQQDKEKYSVK